MEMNEIIGKALEQAMAEAVEQKVAEKMQEVEAKNLETLQAKLDLIDSFGAEDITSIFNHLSKTNEVFQHLLDTYYENRLYDNLTVDDVEEVDLLNDCFERYVENGDVRNIIKDLVDRL